MPSKKKPEEKKCSTMAQCQKTAMIAIVAFILAVTMSLVVISINKYFNLGDDNQVEEFIEDVVGNVTRIEVDYTPFSEEK